MTMRMLGDLKSSYKAPSFSYKLLSSSWTGAAEKERTPPLPPSPSPPPSSYQKRKDARESSPLCAFRLGRENLLSEFPRARIFPRRFTVDTLYAISQIEPSSTIVQYYLTLIRHHLTGPASWTAFSSSAATATSTTYSSNCDVPILEYL